MKTLPIVLAFCFWGICTTEEQSATTLLPDAPIENTAYSSRHLPPVERLGSGSYLASRFAQQNQDWKSANTFIDTLLEFNHNEGEITRRAMILAMGAGEQKKALELARKIKAEGINDPSLIVADIFLIADAMARDETKTAKTLIEGLPNDTTANFVKPFLEGWNNAAEKKLAVSQLKENTIQLYHAILISDFLNDHSALEKIFNTGVLKDNDNPADMERIADLYAHSGLKNRAIELYKKVQKDWPDDDSIQKKIDAVQDGTNKPLFAKITSAKLGMATAFHDIASVLFKDYNDESARIFANLALIMSPEMLEPKFLLAQISARHNQYEDAISYYKLIPEDDKNAINAQFKISELLEESGKPDEALAVLKNLEANHDDIEIQINIGDFHRRQEDYAQALVSYDHALKKLGDTIPPEYWGIHYARGICFEQIGKWDEAEKELKIALELQPDHPHVLNYLGYGWADRGVHLDEALTMIKRAVELRPDDGYIVDSLGWAMYRMGNYTDAVPNLEKAVALLPYDPTINDHLGDAYWRIGRQREALFQWMRAKNHSTDQEQIDEVSEKLMSGLPEQTHLLGENSHK